MAGRRLSEGLIKAGKVVPREVYTEERGTKTGGQKKRMLTKRGDTVKNYLAGGSTKKSPSTKKSYLVETPVTNGGIARTTMMEP